MRATSIPSNSQLPNDGYSMIGHVDGEYDMANFGMQGENCLEQMNFVGNQG